MKIKTVIHPWFVYSTHLVAIQLVKYKQEDETTYSYNSLINIFLDDGESEKLNDERVVCISTDIFDVDMEECLKDTVMTVSTLYSKLSQFAQIVDGDTGKVIEEIDLETLDFSEYEQDSDKDSETIIPTNRVLH